MKNSIIKVIFLFILFSNKSYSQVKSEDSLTTKISKDFIMSYIKSLSKPRKVFRNQFIKKIEENMQFEKMYMEKRGTDQKFIIIPLKKVYFSQHAYNQTNRPLQYMLIVEDDKDLGKIYRSDLILFFPKDKKLNDIPKNAFANFSTQSKNQIDGVYKYINWGDVKQMEMHVENGERKKSIGWQSKSNFNNTGENDCIEWSLETDIYNKDQTVTSTSQILGKTCTECPPGFKCDPIK